MYNFLVAYGKDAWKQEVYEFDRSRVFEYTETSISERYKDLAPEVIEELKSIPTLFCVEGEEATSRVGYITDIKVKDGRVRIEFRFDSRVRPIRRGKIEAASVLFELGRFELSRTHWAIKDGDLWVILKRMGLKVGAAKRRAKKDMAAVEPAIATEPDASKHQVFIVHGHDDVAKYEMAAELRRLGCEAVILHEQASGGMTVIEKIEHYTNVGFAVVLYTPCDIGGMKSEELSLSPRARQNVLFEHGYLIGKLGRKRVMAFVKGRVETPSDISGVVYIPLDDKNAWKAALKTEMVAADYLPKCPTKR